MPAQPLISIVDDDQLMRDSMRQLVKSFGFAVATFPSATAFLTSPDLDETACLIADVQMPGMTGIDLQDKLIADGHYKPIIFMSALSAEEAGARVMDTEVFGFLRKPFSDERLIDCLDRALKCVDAKHP